MHEVPGLPAAHCRRRPDVSRKISARPSLICRPNTVPSALSNCGDILFVGAPGILVTLIHQRKRSDSIELLDAMPSVARLSLGRAEAARQGAEAVCEN